MKITGFDIDAVHVNHRGDWVFVHVNTDAGVRGIGELLAGKNYAGRVAAVRELEGALTGWDPRRIAQIVHEFSRGEPGRDRVCALSAVEQALWDILGKSLGAPVHALLGGACRQEVRLYANINRATVDRTPEGFARNAAAAVAEGFDAVKLAPFDGMPMGMDSAKEAGPGIACMRAVREAIGPDADLMIDCHSHLTVQGALEVADALRDLGLFWYEQPTPESDVAACLEVKRRCGLRVAGGEERMLRRGFREALERGMMDVIMPDVTVVGGIGELKRVAEMAGAWGIPTSPHGPFGPVMIAAGVQAMAAHPDFLILEFGWGEVPWRSDLTIPAEKIVNGRVALRETPGLGVELNMETVEAHRVTIG